MLITSLRPGVYVSFRSRGGVTVTSGRRGSVIMPVRLDFGPVGEFVTVRPGEDTTELLGRSIYSTELDGLLTEGKSELALVREALKKASEVTLYRVCGGAKAAISSGGLTAEAVCPGSFGNSLSFEVKESGSGYTYTVYSGSEKAFGGQASSASEMENPFVKFTGTLSQKSFTTLAGGSDSEPSLSDYTAFFETAKTRQFNTACYTGTNPSVKSAMLGFVRSMREDEGKLISAVCGDYAADYEGLISVKNGIVLENGTPLSAEMCAAFIAGATAAAGPAESLTYSKYQGGVIPNPVMLSADIEAALAEGHIVFSEGYDSGAVVEKDINTLTSYNSEKGYAFSKNRVLRVLDEIAGSIRTLCMRLVIGKLPNSADGRNILKNSVITYLASLEQDGAITGFDRSSDVSVTAGAEPDQVGIEIAIRPVDSFEKISMSIDVL